MQTSSKNILVVRITATHRVYFKLRNAEGFWYSLDEWNFKTNDDLIYIENISKAKGLGTANDSKVILEDFKVDKAGQLWKKGIPNAEGFFTFENSVVPKVITFISGHLEIKGNKSQRQKHS